MDLVSGESVRNADAPSPKSLLVHFSAEKSFVGTGADSYPVAIYVFCGSRPRASIHPRIQSSHTTKHVNNDWVRVWGGGVRETVGGGGAWKECLGGGGFFSLTHLNITLYVYYCMCTTYSSNYKVDKRNQFTNMILLPF